MARPVILGNGALTVGLNEFGLVHDFYYPYVGLENLTNARSEPHKIGVWVDGEFSWTDDGSWNISVDFRSGSLVSSVQMYSEKLSIRLEFEDFVDWDINSFVRTVKLTNESFEKRTVKLFFHQVFQIGRDGREDTALYVPDENYILDYKGRACLLITAQDSVGNGFSEFAIGNYGIEGKVGTFKDAEDGMLSGSAIEHGGVDSVIGFSRELAPNSSENYEYWIIAADSQYHLEKIQREIKSEGIPARLNSTVSKWQDWLSKSDEQTKKLPTEYQDHVSKSLMVIKSHIDKRGGIVASCDSSIYNYGRDYYSYVWPRDGSYALWPLIRLGYTEEAKKFFLFCRDIQNPGGYMMHKYQPDRAIGSTWHPLLHGKRKELAIQEDETAVVIFMLGEYLDYSGDIRFVEELYESLVKPACQFMCEFIDEPTGLPHASYDLWEEKFMTHTYTTSLVFAALKVASSFAEKFHDTENSALWHQTAQSLLRNVGAFYDDTRGYFRKGYLLSETGSLQFDSTLDVSSFFAAYMFGYAGSKEQIISTASKIEEILLDQSPSGGTPRYEHDGYFQSTHPYMGNPWFVSTLWMSQYYSRIDDREKAKKYIDWSISKTLGSGVLSEQVDPETSEIKSVAPLVWSHAELINAILDL